MSGENFEIGDVRLTYAERDRSPPPPDLGGEPRFALAPGELDGFRYRRRVRMVTDLRGLCCSVRDADTGEELCVRQVRLVAALTLLAEAEVYVRDDFGKFVVDDGDGGTGRAMTRVERWVVILDGGGTGGSGGGEGEGGGRL